MTKEMVIVMVRDDGIGFDSDIQKTGSFGLMGMKERVELLEGEMTIDSHQGVGTLVSVKVPLNDSIEK